MKGTSRAFGGNSYLISTRRSPRYYNNGQLDEENEELNEEIIDSVING
jgi:hypothetical protein